MAERTVLSGYLPHCWRFSPSSRAHRHLFCCHTTSSIFLSLMPGPILDLQASHVSPCPFCGQPPDSTRSPKSRRHASILQDHKLCSQLRFLCAIKALWLPLGGGPKGCRTTRHCPDDQTSKKQADYSDANKKSVAAFPFCEHKTPLQNETFESE